MMLWNIATLGGGIGYPAKRTDAVIDAIASTIAFEKPDIVAIIEVMRKARPPIEPRFYTPIDIGRLRMTLPYALERGLERLAGEALEDFKAETLLQDMGRRKIYERRSIEIKYDDIRGGYSKAATDRTNRANLHIALKRAFIISFNKYFSRQAGDIFDDNTSATKTVSDVKSLIRERDKPYIDDDELVADLLAEYGVKRWYQLPGKPYLKGLEDSEIEAETGRYSAAYAIVVAIRYLVRIEYHKQLLRMFQRSSTPRIGKRYVYKKTYSDQLFRLMIIHLQDEPDERERKLEQFAAIRAQWNDGAANVGNSGTAELVRILTALTGKPGCDSYVVWPGNTAPDDTDADTDEKSLEGDTLASDILYSENETYGLFIRREDDDGAENTSLEKITRLAGFTKRAPFMFQVEHKGTPINLILWHAPANSTRNTTARTNNFPVFMQAAKDASDSLGAATFSLADFNIDTSMFDSIGNYEGGETASDFFDAISGNAGYHANTAFWNLKTTLKQSPAFQIVRTQEVESVAVTTDDGTSNKLIFGASAFDKIVLYEPGAANWYPVAEVVYPLPRMLGPSGLNDSIGPFIRIEGDGSEERFNFDGIDGLADVLKDEAYAAETSTNPRYKALSDLISQARLVSDHLPLVAIYERI